MAQNLDYVITNSFCYEDENDSCNKFGRLYNWNLAKKACPEGWHLPTDNEWRNMARYYGGCDDDDINTRGEKAYTALVDNETYGFSALLGGIRYASSRRFKDINSHGYYWSSIEKDETDAWRYIFSNNKLRRGFGGKVVSRSCRCIQD